MIGAVLFDAGHTLLEFDYALLTAQLTARGHDVTEARVTEAERRARIALDTEQANQPTRAKLGAGRYLRYLLGGLGISSDEEVAAITRGAAHSTCRSACATRPMPRRSRR